MEVASLRNKRMIASFKDLQVYQKAFSVSLKVHKTSLDFPKAEQFSLTDQIRRSSRSICANLAEGFGKQRASKAEFRRFLTMAIGSAHEMLVWIDYSAELGYIDQETAKSWEGEYQSVTKMLQAPYNNAN